ncbi:MAG: HAD family phosphatase [Ruminococcaceae bacterium]|nr:HAD family phosphatase [Oscillospiraceae bacterium]
MKKFEGLLFCTDLDGTLYSNDKTVSKENLASIEYFKSEGGIFTFITGREPKTAKDICKTISPNAPYGCLNGGGIYDYQQDKYLWKIALCDEVSELICLVDEQMPLVGIMLNTGNEIIFSKDNAAMQWFRAVTGVSKITGDYNQVKEPILKVVFAHESGEELDKLARLLASHPLADKFDFIRSEFKLFEILPKGASKGNLLCKMAKLLNIDMEKTIAVGDYNNDVSMIKAAGIGFAVANAVPEAKAAADYITVSNNGSAIAAIINGIDKGVYKV